MILIDILAIIGIIITVTATIIVLYLHFKANRCYGCCWSRRGNINSSRISPSLSPEMYHTLAWIIRERQRERVRINNEESKKEIELTEMRRKNKEAVIIINPDNNIQLGMV